MQTDASERQNSELQQFRHEVNNALTGILGHTQLLLLRGRIDEKSRERVEKIEELSNRIRTAIANLND